MSETVEQLRAAWNAQADAMNSWDELGLDEIVHFAQVRAEESALCGSGAGCLYKEAMIEAGEDAKARYHWLRDNESADWRPIALRSGCTASAADALVDAAMAEERAD